MCCRLLHLSVADKLSHSVSIPSVCACMPRCACRCTAPVAPDLNRPTIRVPTRPSLADPGGTGTTRSLRLLLSGDSTTWCSGGMCSSCRMLARVAGGAVAVSASTARGCRWFVSRWPNLCDSIKTATTKVIQLTSARCMTRVYCVLASCVQAVDVGTHDDIHIHALSTAMLMTRIASRCSGVCEPQVSRGTTMVTWC